MEQNNQNLTSPEVPQAPMPEPKLRLKDKAKELFETAYKHKAIFWLVTSMFALIVLITLVGIIFKLANSGGKTLSTLPTPSPVAVTPKDGTENAPLDLVKAELDKINLELNNFDIFQKKLQPPTVDFKVDF